MRVLITGSRDWEGLAAENRVYLVLDKVAELSYVLGLPLVLVHGDCPTGADPCADRWGMRRHKFVTVERHPADWATYGKAAGPIRNKIMVDLGADMCIGFLRNNSDGTSGTLRLAREAKIPTFVIDWEEEWDVAKNYPYSRTDSGGTGPSSRAA
jgi:YspA, cpYpsA-related SLOG family